MKAFFLPNQWTNNNEMKWHHTQKKIACREKSVKDEEKRRRDL